MKSVTYTLEIVIHETGFKEDEVYALIEHEIIAPYDQSNLIFDEEDLRRLKLVRELKENCEPNFESLQVILHLIDQINYLQKKSH